MCVLHQHNMTNRKCSLQSLQLLWIPCSSFPLTRWRVIATTETQHERCENSKEQKIWEIVRNKSENSSSKVWALFSSSCQRCSSGISFLLFIPFMRKLIVSRIRTQIYERGLPVDDCNGDAYLHLFFGRSARHFIFVRNANFACILSSGSCIADCSYIRLTQLWPSNVLLQRTKIIAKITNEATHSDRNTALPNQVNS